MRLPLTHLTSVVNGAPTCLEVVPIWGHFDLCYKGVVLVELNSNGEDLNKYKIVINAKN